LQLAQQGRIKGRGGIRPLGLLQLPLAAIAAINSGQFMAWPVSPSTLAAASKALRFADIAGWFDGIGS
jgi:hypothetical protein